MTQPVGSQQYMNAYSLLKPSAEETQLYTRAAKVDQDKSSTGSSSALQTDIKSYLDKIPKGEDNTLSFSEVDDYRSKMEAKWDIQVTADLEALGVDVTKQLPLSYDAATGKVTVAKDHPDKEIIDKYFEDNPDKVEEFKTIIQLGKLTQTASASTQLSPTQYRQSLQLQSLSWWFADNSNPSDWFSGGGLLFGQGQTAYTGLNLQV